MCAYDGAVLCVCYCKRWKGPTEGSGTMATAITRVFLFLLLLWLSSCAVRFPSINNVQTNNSANFTSTISLHRNLNAYLNRGYMTNVQRNLPLNFRRISSFQNLPPNYGQTIQENPLLNYRRIVQDKPNYRKSSSSPIIMQEDSIIKSRYMSHTDGNLSQIYSQARLQHNEQHTGEKYDYRIPEGGDSDPPFSYRQQGNEDKLLNPAQENGYGEISKHNLSSDSRRRQIARNITKRSELGEARRMGEPEMLKMSSEDQELMLLDALHHKTNSSRRGFEASLADMLGKSESFLIMVQQTP